MPLSRAVLDSSPVAVASPRRLPLKRTASTASLPTPPHTRHKRKHSRGSERETDSNSGSETRSDTDDDGSGLLRNKKRRTSARLRDLADLKEENQFWSGTATQDQELPKEKGHSVKKTQIRSDHRPQTTSPSVDTVPLPRRSTLQAPVSPPPSRRQTILRIARPVTPRKSAVTPQVVDDAFGPVRDSPNNPFLDTPQPSLNDASPTEPRTPTSFDFAEKPTITYVFRGMKAEFDNPLFQLSPSALARAALPVEDPEFSPTAVCPPRLLFPEAHKARKSRSRPTRALRSPGVEKTSEQLTFQKELDLLQIAGEKGGKRGMNPVRR